MSHPPHPLIPRRDLDFLLYEWLKADLSYGRPPFEEHSRETVDAVLDLSERLAVDMFLPHYKESDQCEPFQDTAGDVQVLQAVGDALWQYARAGLFSAGFAPELGGMNLPYLVHAASFSLFAAANLATSAYAMLTIANARLIATHGTHAQAQQFAAPQIQGRWFGTMCLSEPQAGSSLADIRTRAEFDGDDELGARYRLTGNKMWISGGDQNLSENIVHLVLAKVPGADGALIEGTEGISLFIVPKLLPDGRRNDVTVAGLNHKMGYRGTANCLLNFGESGGATGWMVGAPGQGLRQMFSMMNEARIGVALGAAAVGYRGFRHALAYAQDRLQGRKPGTKTGPPIPIIEHADVKRMLLSQKAYAEGALALCLYCAKLVDQHSDAASADLLSLLTPIAKTWSSEYGLAANDISIQIHGGYGYTRDFDVEQLYRDNRLNPIHEGTTGVQAMDLLARKVLPQPAAGLAVLRTRVEATCRAVWELPELVAHAKALMNAWNEIEAAIALLRDVPRSRAVENSVPFLQAIGHVVVAWLWLEQASVARAAQGRVTGDQAFYAGKLRACRFFFEFELPRVSAWLAPVVALSDAAANATPEMF